MARLHRQPTCVASALLVPMLSIASPAWLAVDGVAPSWAVLWLLPWALVDGPVSGAMAGAALGLVLDGLSLDGGSQVPALLLMGWWWGRLGRRVVLIQRSLNLGLLAWLGALLLGLTLLVQLFLRPELVLDQAFTGDDPSINKILPGMEVDVRIRTGRRTLLDYLLRPATAPKRLL